MTIMWTNICTILQTITLISADRTGKIFKKVLPKLCHCEQCVLCHLSVFCLLQGCCVSLCYCALLSLWVHWKQWLPHLSWAAPLNCQNHYQRCLFENMSTSVLHVQIKRICFHLQWNCSWSEIRWFADSWQMEACSYHVPPQPATQFKFYFHASALTILSCIYMHEI